MLVANKAGYTISFVENGRKYVIPFDRRPYEVPDSTLGKYGELFHIIVPPKPNPLPKAVEKTPEPVEVKIEESKPKKKTKPLKGVKIKKKKREELRKRKKCTYGT